MKKYLPFIIIGVAVLITGIGAIAFAMSNKKVPEPEAPKTTKKKVTKPVNQISFEERPYVIMAPTAGREVDVTVVSLPKPADSVEYLAEYQYGTSLGGNEQFIDLKKGLPGKKEFALYSRSAGGKTSYEEDVQGGTLRLDFTGQNEYSLLQDWKYLDNKEKQTTFASKNGKFSVSSKDLASLRYGIIYNSPGLPSPLEGKILSEVYTLQFSSPTPAKKVDVTIETSGGTSANIQGWDGKQWKTYPAKMNGNKATATVDILEAYVVTE